MNDILLTPIRLCELEILIQNSVERALFENNKKQTTTQSPEEFLTIQQVSKLLGVSLVTLHKWKKEGKIKFHRFGSRIRFKKSEIMNVGKSGGKL